MLYRRTAQALLTGLLLLPTALLAQQPSPIDQFKTQQEQREREAFQRRNPNTLTLEQAVNRALDENLDIRRAENSLAISQQDVRQAKLGYLPDVTASIGFNRSFGTAFDQVSFRRIERSTNTSSPQLNLSLPLFQGFAQLYTLRQNRALQKASEQALIRQRNTVLQNVTLAYLQVIFDQSNVDISRTRIQLLRAQQQRQQALFDAGTAVRFDVLNTQSQVAVEEQTLITAVNTLRADKIRLLQLLQIQPLDSLDGGYDFAPIDTAYVAKQITRESLPPITQVEETAFASMPDLQESQYRIKAGLYAQKFAYAQFSPRLTLNAGVNSNYTSNDRTSDSVGVGFSPLRQFDATGSLVSSTFLRQTISQEGNPVAYIQQIRQNQSEFIGINLSIPLFTGWQVQRNYQVAKIQTDNARLDYETRKNQLTLQVRQAYFDVIAAQEQQQSLQRQAAALNEAFTAAEAQFNAGLIDFTQYLDALNNRSRIEQQQFQSLYNYFLRRKVLDLFQGKPVTF